MFNEETKMYEGYIYKITNCVNDKIYIGQTRRNLSVRLNDHFVASNKKSDNTTFHLAIKSIGEDAFEIHRVEKVTSNDYSAFRKKLNERERYYIQLYDCIYPNGYNTSKGCGGSGEKLKNDPKPCSLYDFDGELIESFSSIKEASEKYNISACAISDCCRGKHYRTSVGVFRFIDDKFDKFKIIPNSRLRGETPVDKYSLFGDYICSYDRIKDAAVENNITIGQAQYYVENCTLIDSSYVLIKHEDTFNILDVKPLGKKVDELDDNGNVINSYKNISEASRKTNVSTTSIYECCTHKYVHAKHHIFQYHDVEIINKAMQILLQ